MTALDEAGRTITTSIETYSGLYLDYLDPQPEQIELVDIARGLAFECRYGRQVTTFYSVAEHALYVCELVSNVGYPELAFAALHHDSAEAYMGDLTKPMKWALDGSLVKKIDTGISEAIAEKFGFIADSLAHRVIKQCDVYALRREAATLKWSHGTGPHWGWDEALAPLPGIGLSPTEAERAFINKHEELCPN